MRSVEFHRHSEEAAARFRTGTERFAPLYYGLALALRPKVMVETGVLHGYTTAYLAAAAKEIGAAFYAIDNFSESPQASAEAHLERCGVRDGVTLINGDAVSTMERLKAEGALAGLGLAVLDDIHDYRQVSLELYSLWPVLAEGGMIGGHDALNRDYEGVHRAYLDFERDAHAAGFWINGNCGVCFLQKLERPLAAQHWKGWQS